MDEIDELHARIRKLVKESRRLMALHNGVVNEYEQICRRIGEIKRTRQKTAPPPGETKRISKVAL